MIRELVSKTHEKLMYLWWDVVYWAVFLIARPIRVAWDAIGSALDDAAEHDEYERRLTIIAILELACFFGLWASYECWKFGKCFWLFPCGMPQAWVLGVMAIVCGVVGVWLMIPVKIPPQEE